MGQIMGQNTNGDQTMGLDLTRFAADLAGRRDDHQALYDEFGDRSDLGRARAYRVMLDMLYLNTGGEFGQMLGDQPDAKAGR
jgi:hypothetical protein